MDAHLGDAKEATVGATPHAAADDVLALGQEREGECTNPAYHLAALPGITHLQALVLRDHCVLHS